MTNETTGLHALRVPFPPEQIDQLPKGRVVLSYVGHAHVTARLLDVDPEWIWEPVAFGTDGLPLLDDDGGLWIRLTICGITRLGYGHADGDKGLNATKEAIGDAIRNAAMRFGVALELWAKDKPASAAPAAHTVTALARFESQAKQSSDIDDLRTLHRAVSALPESEQRTTLLDFITSKATGLQQSLAKEADQPKPSRNTVRTPA